MKRIFLTALVGLFLVPGVATAHAHRPDKATARGIAIEQAQKTARKVGPIIKTKPKFVYQIGKTPHSFTFAVPVSFVDQSAISYCVKVTHTLRASFIRGCTIVAPAPSATASQVLNLNLVQQRAEVTAKLECASRERTIAGVVRVRCDDDGKGWARGCTYSSSSRRGAICMVRFRLRVGGPYPFRKYQIYNAVFSARQSSRGYTESVSEWVRVDS